MVREFSAGGVVLRRMRGRWWIAAIEPHNTTGVIALPKGNIDPGERPEATAQREVREETGVEASLVRKLIDARYFYIRSWGDGERVFKVVSFYLFTYRGGTIDHIEPAMRKEVRRAFWLALDEAPERLSYKGEKEVARRARAYVDKEVDK
jgi:8-oxo-dGTP pyrophosphatase MutT (NUDIX family)